MDLVDWMLVVLVMAIVLHTILSELAQWTGRRQ